MADLIDRQAAIDIFCRLLSIDGYNCGERNIIKAAINEIEGLPSAEPKRKIGSWVTDDEFIDCSICRREKWSRVPYENLVKKFRYCPRCGAAMTEDAE